MYRPSYLRKIKNDRNIYSISESPNIVVEHKDVTKFRGVLRIPCKLVKNIPENIVREYLLEDMVRKTELCDFLEFDREHIPESDEILYRAILRVVK